MVQIAGREVPTPLVVGGGVLGLYLAYHWYKNRSSSTAATSPAAQPNAGQPGVQVIAEPGPVGARGPAGPPGPQGPIDCGPRPAPKPGYWWHCTSRGWVPVTNTGCKGSKPPPKKGFVIVCGGTQWIYVPAGNAAEAAAQVPLGKGPVSSTARPSGPLVTAGAPAGRSPRIVGQGGTHEGGMPAAHRANGTPAARPAGTNTMAYRDYRMPGPPTPPPPSKAPTGGPSAPQPPRGRKAASKPSTGKRK